MAYGAMASKSDGDTFDLSDYNQINANFEASAADIVTTKGDIVVATSADALVRLAVGANDATPVADSGQSTGLAWQIQPACRVYNNAEIDPTPSTWVALTFNSERFDTDSMHSTASNTSRITIPSSGAGIYLVGGSCAIQQGGNAAHFGIRVLLNGATAIAQHGFLDLTSGADQSSVFSVSAIYSLAVSDYVELQVYTENNKNVKVISNVSPEFWAIWQRRQ